MSLLNGSLSVSRFHARLPKSGQIDFEAAAFTPIPEGSEIRRSVGFVPMLSDAEPYEVGAKRWAFRVRIDEIVPDKTAVKDRYDELCRQELESGAPALGAKRKKKLRELAIEELSLGVPPARRYIEAVLDGLVLFVATTNRKDISEVVRLLGKIGVEANIPVTPWGDRDLEEMEHSFLECRHPGQSAWGARFLRTLPGRSKDLDYETVKGQVSVQTVETRGRFSGEVVADLHRYLELGAEILAAKLATPESTFSLDALSWWIRGLSLSAQAADHWTDQLDLRLEKVREVFDLLDRLFAESIPAIERELDGRAWTQSRIRGAPGPHQQFREALDEADRKSKASLDAALRLLDASSGLERRDGQEGDSP